MIDSGGEHREAHARHGLAAALAAARLARLARLDAVRTQCRDEAMEPEGARVADEKRQVAAHDSVHVRVARFLRVCLAQLEPHRDVPLEQTKLLTDLAQQAWHVLALAVVARRLLQLAGEAGQEAGRNDARRALELVGLLDYIWLQPGLHAVAAWITCGCSLDYMWLQPLSTWAACYIR